MDTIDYRQEAAGGLLDNYPDIDKPSCQLLGPTALVVQALMGVLVILSLVYKRHRESPKRPWRIWLFDVSKQVFGQMFVHGVNVLISDIISHLTSANACVFYFLNILIDTTLGVALIYVILHLLTHLFSVTFNLKGFESGLYGDPPSITFWLRQAAVYVLSLTTMKFLVIGLLVLFPGIFRIAEWLLSWTSMGNGDALQVIFTMGIFPIIMNVLQFWLIDSIVKASASLELTNNMPDAFNGDDREPLFRSSEDDDYRPSDIENQLSRSHSPGDAHSIPQDDSFAEDTLAGDSDAPKSGACSSTQPVEAHSYPPSLSSSITSNSSSLTREPSKVPKEAKNLLKKTNRRGPPAPLNIHSMHRPAVNSPQLSATKQATAPPRTPSPQPTAAKMEIAVAHEQDDWAENWDQGDDDWDTRDDRKGMPISIERSNDIGSQVGS